MIDLFLPHVESKVQATRTGILAGRLEEVERAAHAIRSSSGNLGADELGAIAGSIETLAMERRGQEIAPLVLALEDAFTRVRDRLRKERDAGNECDG
jgi:HPt (histidine-containing phosphotransfer) domain-containing protein